MNKSKVFEGIDWSNGSDHGYFVVSIGPDPTPETVQAFRDAYDLGCAWAEAEAALPEGMTLKLEHDPSLSDFPTSADVIEYAEWSIAHVDAESPAAALRALASKLRERAR